MPKFNVQRVYKSIGFEVIVKLARISKKIKGLQQLVIQLGVLNAGLYTANRLAWLLPVAISLNKYYFVVQSLSEQPLLPIGKGRRFRVVELSVDDLNMHPCPRPVAVLADRYAQGALCLTAFKEQEFAGCLWYIDSAYQEDEVRCDYRLPPQVVWDFDVYVEPKYRLTPVFLKLWDEASVKLTQNGYLWSLSRISAFNSSSLFSHKRMGARIFAWAVFIRFGTMQLAISSLQPFFHLSFAETSRPVFKFQLPKI